MRKLTSVLMVIAVAVTLAIPAGASGRVSHRLPKGHGCKSDDGRVSHQFGKCKKNRHDGNLSHRFQDHPFRGA